MVTDRQVRRLRMELGKGEPLATAALRSGMSENTARRYRAGAAHPTGAVGVPAVARTEN